MIKFNLFEDGRSRVLGKLSNISSVKDIRLLGHNEALIVLDVGEDHAIEYLKSYIAFSLKGRLFIMEETEDVACLCLYYESLDNTNIGKHKNLNSDENS